MHKLEEFFIDFFTKKGFLYKFPSPLVQNFETGILFCNAGMNQFKHIFESENPTEKNNFITCQKCLRITGKHNDMNTIGKSKYHMTNFTMLGHFMFNIENEIEIKKIIFYIYEFLIKSCNLSVEDLYITYHPDCYQEIKNSVFDIKNKTGINIYENKENIWSAGKNAPWGYCVEFFYKDEKEDLELWNCVIVCGKENLRFKKYRIDTGGGLERLISVQERSFNVFNNVKKIDKLNTKDSNMIYDHIKSSVLIMRESILPSNKVHGYILRMLLRRVFAVILSNNVDLETLFTFNKELLDFKQSIDQEYSEFKTACYKGLKYFIKEFEKKELKIKEIINKAYNTYGIYPIFIYRYLNGIQNFT